MLSPPRTNEGTLPTDYTFTGQRVDASAGLLYYGARYYDWVIGRFTQPDTIVPDQYNPQSLNRYSYVLNNPVKYTDPTGHAWCDDHVCQGDIDDPLDYTWQSGFWRDHERPATWEDVQIRLFSLAYPKDYRSSDFYDASGRLIPSGLERVFRDTSTRSWDNLDTAIGRLRQAYSPGSTEKLARDIASLWGGMLNRIEQPDTARALLARNAHEDGWVWVAGGSMPDWMIGTDRDGNVHHWASTVLGGAYAAKATGHPWLGSALAVAANHVFEQVQFPLNIWRDGLQDAESNRQADIWTGFLGALYGALLR